MRASCSKRRTSSGLETSDPLISLSATSRPSRVSRARYTSAIPPAPSRESTSYGPTLVPGARLTFAQTTRMVRVARRGCADRETVPLGGVHVRGVRVGGTPGTAQSDSVGRQRFLDARSPRALARRAEVARVQPPPAVDERHGGDGRDRVGVR